MTATRVKTLHKGEFTDLSLHTAEDGSQFVRKSSFYPGSEKLVEEAKFILETLPPGAHSYFPKIIGKKPSHQVGEIYYYDMVYYPGKLLRQRIIDDSDDADVANSDIERTLSALKTGLHDFRATASPPEFMHRHYVGRIASRLAKYVKPRRVSKHDIVATNELTQDEVDDFFANVIHRPAVRINGDELLTPLEILRRVNNDDNLKKFIMPSPHSMGFIHGDPHLGNVMLRDDSRMPLFFDPNGFHVGGDIAYDLGKFILSLEYLDMLLERQVNYPQIEWNENEIKIGGLKNFHSPKKGEMIADCSLSLIDHMLPSLFADRLSNDPLLIKRSIFVAGLHAFACAHTFIPTKNKDAAIPLLIYFMQFTNVQLKQLVREGSNE